MLKGLKKNYVLLVSTFFVLYFFFNLMSGERGLISYIEKKEILQNLKEKELQLSYKIENLDLKNSLLSDNLDLDYIETLIRERFLFGKKEEKIFIIKNNDTKN
ncbi:septum formation initiator family protein [Candidatus Pelagibacter sp.]|nr:septum formation initiator family protein [Candidatus Pelagibacter sp.]